MVNDNKPRYVIGAALMNMLNDMNVAQARIYRAGGTQDEAMTEVMRLHSLHQPRVFQTIKRADT